MGSPTYFNDDAAIALRVVEVPLASFVNGMNLGGSCAPGIGINIDGGAVVGTPEQFTLLDQRELARTTQRSQSIGGFPYVPAVDYPSSGGQEGYLPDSVIYVADPSVNGDGSAANIGNASLDDLAIGWVIGV
jgi:hypothetical protein